MAFKIYPPVKYLEVCDEFPDEETKVTVEIHLSKYGWCIVETKYEWETGTYIEKAGPMGYAFYEYKKDDRVSDFLDYLGIETGLYKDDEDDNKAEGGD